MKTKHIIAVGLFAVCVVVLASLGLSFTGPGAPIRLLGMRIPAVDSEFIPPAAGALALAGGLVVLLVMKSKRVG